MRTPAKKSAQVAAAPICNLSLPYECMATHRATLLASLASNWLLHSFCNTNCLVTHRNCLATLPALANPSASNWLLHCLLGLPYECMATRRATSQYGNFSSVELPFLLIYQAYGPNSVAPTNSR
eukprot:TRINITY_DN98590_c0_g1_i1.p1 TRINITY_DN98590_c0_g1~~TRINITY_DN98590_c0_g1_i1.p1  ORF type:complete len:124 (+),score=6.65 TRINITY_DN98590_c0_g1_i1:40-411(+)